MKAVIEFLDKRIKVPDKAGKIIGWVFSVLFAVSVALFGYLSLKMDIWICAVLFFITGVPLIVFRLYRTVFNNTVLIHLLVAAAIIMLDIKIAEIEYEKTPEIVFLLTAVCSVVFLGFLEIAAGFLMDFSGGETHPEYFRKSLIYSFPLFFTVFFFIPAETYFGNWMDFEYIFIDFVLYLAIKTVLCSVLLSVMICAFKKTAFEVLTGCITGLTLCVYAQYMFMNGNLRIILGDPADWESH